MKCERCHIELTPKTVNSKVFVPVCRNKVACDARTAARIQKQIQKAVLGK